MSIAATSDKSGQCFTAGINSGLCRRRQSTSRAAGGESRWRRCYEAKSNIFAWCAAEMITLAKKFLAQLAGLQSSGDRFALQAAVLPSPQASGETVLRILHLSDLHFRSPSHFDQDTVLSRLLDCVSGIGDLDAVVLTGDLADKGLPAEYDALTTWLTDRLSASSSVPPDEFYLVPGNHDVDRTLLTQSHASLRRGLVNSYTSDDRLSNLFDAGPESDLYSNQLHAYRQFAASLTGRAVGSFGHWSTVIRRENLHLALAGLNRAYPFAG